MWWAIGAGNGALHTTRFCGLEKALAAARTSTWGIFGRVGWVAAKEGDVGRKGKRTPRCWL